MSIFGKSKNIKEPAARKTEYKRKSKETDVEISLLNIDGVGESKISTTIPFLDHMLTLFSYHGFFDLNIKASGDTHIDNHHLNEDIGISLGEAFKKALGDSKGIVRMASAEVPMDMVRAKIVVDLSNRFAFKFIETRPGTQEIKDEEGYSMDSAKDFLEGFAKKLAFNLHIEITGEGDMHHYLEAIFKAFSIALDKATSIDPRRLGEVPSSKGIL